MTHDDLTARAGDAQRADEDAELFASAPVPVARGLGCSVRSRDYECENETTNLPCVCGFVCCDECGDAGRSRCWCTEDDDYR